MNPPKCDEQEYMNFLLGSPKVVTATEAARVQASKEDPAHHDAYTRLLHRLEPEAHVLWEEAKGHVSLGEGILVLDDTTLDKPYAKHIDLVTRHWSGKHKEVVLGINLITLLWTDGDRHIPCDYRLYDKDNDGLSKNDHFTAMLKVAKERGFSPSCVVFDSWYSSLENLKEVRDLGWNFLTRLKENRTVSIHPHEHVAVRDLPVSEQGTRVHLKGYGFILVFKLVATKGDVEYWATNDLLLDDLNRIKYAQYAWTIENYHRGIKQFCGIERAQVRAGRAQRNHIGLSLRAFLRLERFSYQSGFSWFEAKWSIIRPAVQAFMINPFF